MMIHENIRLSFFKVGAHLSQDDVETSRVRHLSVFFNSSDYRVV